MKGLIRRAGTALIFVVVMLVGLFGGRYSFISLFAIITALCLWEYLSMVLNRYTKREKNNLRALFVGVAVNIRRTARWMAGIRPQQRHTGFGLAVAG